MSLVTSKKMLLDAQKGGYAVGAFNAENMEMVMAIVADKMGKPINELRFLSIKEVQE